ncbi:sugar transferase [Caloramator australicus]|uniref:Undecaprenyl-phosphate galactosephosphotransferase n=1 Tax=Caloramator australicus RC3 TaxID=857293 RepID=G0V441_9CLOT|nr:sugar transferase [Caloramator australicus]CCC57881.1 Undecaprenyl-phosphate galactosephosphotransferase [Caloramator australicus RC3]
MYSKYIKRIFDILFAIILLPPVLFVIILFGFLIKLEDRGPVFYCGKRLGKNGKVFKMFKLRTMKVNAPDIRNPDGSTYNSIDDPRLTRIGKFLRKTSLDELPQIFNILKGDMSFIGPRPDLPDHIYYYEGDEIKKLDVLPGITGYNQAYHRNSVEWKKRLENDVYYINNISFILDLKILIRTIIIILLRRGVFNETTHTKSIKINATE